VTVFDSAAPTPGALTPPPAVDLELLRGGLRIIALHALGDADAAEEAVQETLSRAVIALADGRLTDREKLAAYVAGIARHVCSHMLRDRKDTVSLDGDASSGRLADPALMTHSNALETLITAAELERLRLAFRELSSADQQLLRLSFHDERSPSELAEALGEPAERVRKRKSRALDRLRRAFLGRDARRDSHDEHSRGTSKEEVNR
jgi:RNA polymerase sigma factor (sigma-70 family)